ncbi:MAG: class I SAM-dependent methyltransferase [Dehalococcoidales bacterium]|nr:MAG: class I SAM-dependent methyltransferase [Dehalococcoidales bacterium]
MDKTKTWHEDDSFWETWGPLMFTQEKIADAKEEMEKVVTLTELKPGASVLDLCCGIGRCSLELARRGFSVTGVDRTENYLEKARKQAEQENLDVEFVQDDMRRFVRLESFDCVISMFTSWTYFEDPDEDKQVILNAHSSLKPGGKLVIQTGGKETLARIFQERNWKEIDGVIWLVEREVRNNWSWMYNRWIMLKGNERIEGEITHRLYAGSEIVALLTDCGFSRVELFGDLDGNPYNQRAKQLITIGHK